MAGKVRSSDDADFAPIADINVTPFVDVVLVLLVIFMVTAPMLVREQLAVNLPKTQSGEKSASKALSIEIDKSGSILVGGQVVFIDALQDEVKRAMAEDPNVQAVISADQETKHGDVVRVIDVVKQTGLTKFAIQIERQ